MERGRTSWALVSKVAEGAFREDPVADAAHVKGGILLVGSISAHISLLLNKVALFFWGWRSD